MASLVTKETLVILKSRGRREGIFAPRLPACSNKLFLLGSMVCGSIISDTS